MQQRRIKNKQRAAKVRVRVHVAIIERVKERKNKTTFDADK